MCRISYPRWRRPGSLAAIGLFLLAEVAFSAGPARIDYSPGFRVRPADPSTTRHTLDSIAERQAAEPMPKVWVYFTDKQVFDSETCADRLAEVAGTLTEHAVHRRAKTMRGSLVDFYDIPVVHEYVRAVRSTGATILQESRWLNAISVQADLETLEEIAGLPFVQKLTLVRGLRIPREDLDRSPPAQERPKRERDLFDYGPSFDQLNEIGVVAAHNAGYSGQGVIIGMFDTGFKRDHPAFELILAEGRLLAQWDFVNNDDDTMDGPDEIPGTQDHGSACWSVAGGFYEGELIGPAFGATYVLAKTEDVADEYPAEEDNWVAAAEWCDGLGVDVISSSLAYHAWYTPDDMDGDTAVITIGADIAASRGIVVSTGAGNMGDQDWYIVTAPADGDSVIAVGAVDQNNLLAGFSSHGPTADGRMKPEVVARGVGTVCACNFTHDPLNDEFATNSGTSLSCPLVSGCAALLIEAAPAWPAMLIRETLMNTADNADHPDNDRGWGRVDVWAALVLTVDATEWGGEIFDPRLHVSPNPVHNRAHISLELPHAVAWDSTVLLEIFDVAGRRVWSAPFEAAAPSVDWDCRSTQGGWVAPGFYFARVEVDGWSLSSKLLIQ